jgi:hypothetical protein
MLKCIGLGAVLSALAMPVMAEASSATATGSASATVIQAISVVQEADLDFGVVASTPEQSASVTITAGNSVVRYGGGARQACKSNDKCPLPHAASLTVSGEPGRSYKVTAPESVGIAGSDANAAALIVDKISLRTASRPGGSAAGLLDRAGKDRFDLGGTLHLPPGLVPARYRISVPVVASYD